MYPFKVHLHIFLLSMLCFQIYGDFPDAVQRDLSLRHWQKEKLDKFVALVESRMPHEYMKKEIYLIRFLRAYRFNIPVAEKMLMESLQWRKLNNMDAILTEDWEDFERNYPFVVEGCDIEGRPTISVPVGDWDVRAAVIAGKGLKMERYFDKLFEEISWYVRNAQDTGINVTQYNLLMDMSNYNLVLQGCPLCVPIYIHLFETHERNFPGSAHSTTLVNMPQLFISLWQIIKPFLRVETQNSIKLYGKNKMEWQEKLKEFIDPSQLTKEFGGLKEAGWTLEELRERGNIITCALNFKAN